MCVAVSHVFKTFMSYFNPSDLSRLRLNFHCYLLSSALVTEDSMQYLVFTNKDNHRTLSNNYVFLYKSSDIYA